MREREDSRSVSEPKKTNGLEERGPSQENVYSNDKGNEVREERE